MFTSNNEVPHDECKNRWRFLDCSHCVQCNSAAVAVVVNKNKEETSKKEELEESFRKKIEKESFAT